MVEPGVKMETGRRESTGWESMTGEECARGARNKILTRT